MSNSYARRPMAGFTFVELLITVAIIGVLATIAYPSYTDFVKRSNRTEGQRELLHIAGLMEQYFLDQRLYTSDLTALGFSSSTVTTENGHYSIKATVSDDADIFTLTATAIGSQAADTDCKTMTVSNTGAKTSSPSSSGCWE